MAEFTTAYLLRHFPTKKNEGGKSRERLRGWLNEPIDEDAAAEIAPKIAEILGKAGVDCIYCSDLTRGRQTAHAIASAMFSRAKEDTPEIEVRRQFRSWDTGKYTGELREKVWPKIESYIRNPEEKVPGDERFNGEQFGVSHTGSGAGRTGSEDGGGFIGRWERELLHQLRDAQENDGKNAWILHGNQFWTLTALLEGRQPTIDDWKEGYDQAHPGSLYRLEFNDKEFRLDACRTGPGGRESSGMS